MNVKATSLRQNEAPRKRGFGSQESIVYRSLKRDKLFSIDEERQCTNDPRAEQFEKYREKIRLMSNSSTYTRRRLDTQDTGDSNASNEERLFSTQEGRVYTGLQLNSSPIIDLPGYFRDKLRLKKTNSSGIIQSDITKSPVSVIDEILEALEHDMMDDSDEEESDYDDENDDDNFLEMVVPLKEEDNFDGNKLLRLSKGSKRKEELLLDNLWDFPFNTGRVSRRETSSEIEEGFDARDMDNSSHST